MRYTLRDWRSGHRLRATLLVVGILLVGGVLGVGAVKVFHKIDGSTAAQTGAITQASAGYGLSAPTSATVAGPDLFVANQGGSSVTVVNASTGDHVSTLSGASFDLDQPTSITNVGADIFVASGAGDSVTEFDAADRVPVRIITGPQFHFSDPIALAGDSNELFVLSATGAVTGVSPTTGGLLGIATGPQYGFHSPSGIAVSGSDLFVTNRAGNSVSVIDADTLGFVKLLDGTQYRFHTPTAAVIHGGDLWVTNGTSDSVTQLSASNGDLVRVIVDHTNLPTPGPITAGDGYVFTLSPPGVSPMVSQIDPGKGKVTWMMCNTNGPYLLANPQAVAVAGSNLWVVNKDSNSLTEMNTDSGALIRTIS